MKKTSLLKKWGGSFKYIIPSIVVLILIGAIIIGRFLPKQLLGSVYSIDELKENFSKVRVGDTINYEINGYSDWQVLYTDIDNGTIDVVSKTNTEDLALEPNQTKEYYENKFQETANRYIDNNYAISARTVNQSDLDYFNYDNNFWLNTIDDTNITTSQSTWQYIIDMSNVEPNHKMYVIPFVEKYFENYDEYNVGDTIEYSNNGVNRWVVAGQEVWCSSSLVLIPETPIELVIESVDDNISEKADQIIDSFNNDVSSVGNYVNNFGTDNLPNLIPNFLNQQTEKIWFYKSNCYSRFDNTIKLCGGPGISYYQNGAFGGQSSGSIVYTEQGPKTLGYRPVVTLKIKGEIQGKDKQEISNKLQIGDNVKYEAKGYKNWKVLSVDNDLGTVDIISGGIVKNITLSGKEDWDNFEDIIQREVDQYKNGEQAKKATTVTSKDLKTLKEIDKSFLSRYWILSKSSYIKEKKLNNTIDNIYYTIGTIYLYKNNNFEMHSDSIALYVDYIGDDINFVDMYKKNDMYVKSINNSSYTAGLRPVITLKLDSVEKLSEEETKKANDTTAKQEKIYIKEQESKNKDYKGPKTVDDTSSKGTKKDEKDNNTNIIDNDNNNETKVVEKIVYKDNLINKYGFIITSITTLLELVIIIAMYLKFSNK